MEYCTYPIDIANQLVPHLALIFPIHDLYLLATFESNCPLSYLPSMQQIMSIINTAIYINKIHIDCRMLQKPCNIIKTNKIIHIKINTNLQLNLHRLYSRDALPSFGKKLQFLRYNLRQVIHLLIGLFFDNIRYYSIFCRYFRVARFVF